MFTGHWVRGSGLQKVIQVWGHKLGKEVVSEPMGVHSYTYGENTQWEQRLKIENVNTQNSCRTGVGTLQPTGQIQNSRCCLYWCRWGVSKENLEVANGKIKHLCNYFTNIYFGICCCFFFLFLFSKCFSDATSICHFFLIIPSSSVFSNNPWASWGQRLYYFYICIHRA